MVSSTWSVHELLATPSPVMTTQNIPRRCQVSLEGTIAPGENQRHALFAVRVPTIADNAPLPTRESRKTKSSEVKISLSTPGGAEGVKRSLLSVVRKDKFH